MKTSFAALLAVLVTLCTTSTALAETPTPSGDATAIAPVTVSQFYYSEIREGDVAPKVTNDPPAAIAAIEGDDVIMSITYAGKPEPEVEVFRDLEPIFNGGVYVIKSGLNENTGHLTATIFIKRALEDDSGEYTFKLTNKAGEVRAVIRLSVVYDPSPWSSAL